MADYDPRTATGIPTEPVGSLPRPSWLQRAYAQYDAGEITRDQLEAEQDKAVRDSIEHQEETGTPIISDGEQRWSSFATYAITDTLDPRNPWTGRNMLPHFIELNNRVLDRFTAQERASIGIHTCPGGDRDSVHSADVPYSDLLPSMFGINAGYFLIQLASERDKDRVYQLIGEHLRTDANGVTQTAYIGVINPLNPRVESPEEVRDALIRAANFIPAEQLASTDDCGFSPFSIDEKPNHGSPDFARDTAWQKITNRVEGTRLAADKLGIS